MCSVFLCNSDIKLSSSQAWYLRKIHSTFEQTLNGLIQLLIAQIDQLIVGTFAALGLQFDSPVGREYTMHNGHQVQ